MNYDTVIIGAGVVGCAVARELSRNSLSICVLEKGPDVAAGTSKANSAIVHAGYDAIPGSKKAELNIKGAGMYEELCRRLDVPFIRNGSYVVSFLNEEYPKLEELLRRGEKNGVKGLQILSGDEVRRRNPHLSKEIKAALYAPTAGITCPYELTVALAENAAVNGVEFRFNSEVAGIHRLPRGSFLIRLADGGSINAKTIVNAAGVFADDINNMVSTRKLKIIPRKGEYCLFDKAAGVLAGETVFQLPNAMGKGVLVTRTVDGNLLVGPSAVDTGDKCDTETTREGIDYILKAAVRSVDALPLRQIITSFAGLRAHLESDDFLIQEACDVGGFFNAAGIESPGLTAAPAIGDLVAKMVCDRLHPALNPRFTPYRKEILRFRELGEDARWEAIGKDPRYGRIVCRCETVTEGEIVDAIRRSLGTPTLDGIKRRTRAGMGRCQSGFCSTRVMELIARERGIPLSEVTKNGPGSELLVGTNKHIEGVAK